MLEVGGVWRRGPNTLAGCCAEGCRRDGLGRSARFFHFSANQVHGLGEDSSSQPRLRIGRRGSSGVGFGDEAPLPPTKEVKLKYACPSRVRESW